MTQPGHVFVLHGDLLALDCDGVLVPADINFHVTTNWKRWRPNATTHAKMWPHIRDTGVTPARAVDGQIVRHIDSAPGGSDRVAVLKQRVTRGLTALADDVTAKGEPAHKRQRHLIGMPMFSTGQGGMKSIRGEVIEVLLEAAASVASQAGVDIVLVTFTRSDYAAVQHIRRADAWPELSEERCRDADDLGLRARSGNIAFFLGAGVSIAAGLEDWSALLQGIAEARGVPGLDALIKKRPEKAGSSLAAAIGEAEFNAEVAKRLRAKRHAVGHGLLASMKVGEVVTTNVDDLYEMAAAVPFDDCIQVFPWDRAPDQPPWLLKVHGDARRGDLVFTEEQFKAFKKNSGPLHAVVQSLLMTHHLLFVGYSLRDSDFAKLADQVAALLRAKGVLNTVVGTLLLLGPAPDRSKVWHDDLCPIALADDHRDVSVGARRIEIFLDRMAWNASRGELSWVLDDQYVKLLDAQDRALAKKLRELPVEALDRPVWNTIRVALENAGYRARADSGDGGYDSAD